MADDKTALKVPVGLKVKGKKLWTDMTAKYEFRLDELAILEDTCREVDLITAMEKEMRTQPLTVKGSMGQLVPHPLVSELRQHRSVVARLLSGLKLPDDGADTAAGARSAQNRDAANARWGNGA